MISKTLLCQNPLKIILKNNNKNQTQTAQNKNHSNLMSMTSSTLNTKN